MKKIVYVLGNPLVKKDHLPPKLIFQLEKLFPKLKFMLFDPTEDFDLKEKNIIIIDTILSLKKVTQFNDLNLWTISPRISLHDFDLPVYLGLLQKLGKVKKITIIGVPEKGNRKNILSDVTTILKDIEI